MFIVESLSLIRRARASAGYGQSGEEIDNRGHATPKTGRYNCGEGNGLAERPMRDICTG